MLYGKLALQENRSLDSFLVQMRVKDEDQKHVLGRSILQANKADHLCACASHGMLCFAMAISNHCKPYVVNSR